MRRHQMPQTSGVCVRAHTHVCLRMPMRVVGVWHVVVVVVVVVCARVCARVRM